MSEQNATAGAETGAKTGADLVHPALKAVFAKHAERNAETKREAHDQIALIASSVYNVTGHLRELQHDLTLAGLAEHDHSLDDSMKYLHTRLEAARLLGEQAVTMLRGLAGALVEIEHGMTESQAATAAMGAEKLKRTGMIGG